MDETQPKELKFREKTHQTKKRKIRTNYKRKTR